jgi:hypothetical protein
VLVAAAALCWSVAASAGDPYASPNDAYKYGIRAYRAGAADKAIAALDFASRNGMFQATYYLARIYSGRGAHSNDAEAFRLYQQIASEYGRIDRISDWRAPFVARAYIALSDYWRKGIVSAGIAPDPIRAQQALEYAAVYFDDSDAQFALARLYLSPDSDENTRRAGLRWLTTLVDHKGHALASAYLAELFQTGTYVPRSMARALAFITIAVENANDEDRIALEAQYHEIYCRTSPELRLQAERIVDQFHKGTETALAPLDAGGNDEAMLTEIGELSPAFACGDGKVVEKPRSRKALGKAMTLGLKSLDDAGSDDE